MPLRKIRDLERPNICRHREHNPPNMIVLPPGVYEYECPGCGRKMTFTIPERPMCLANDVPARAGRLRYMSWGSRGPRFNSAGT